MCYYLHMAKYDLRLQARVLRKEGRSIKEIAKLLGVARSTSSVWCDDIFLTNKQRKLLAGKMGQAAYIGRLKGAETNRLKKEIVIKKYLEEGLNFFEDLTPRELLIAGLCLYWAEGSKGRGKFSLTNSDPQMIAFYVKWLTVALAIPLGELHPRVFINAIHEPRLKIITQFWASIINIPVSQFANPVLLRDRPKKIYDNHETYYGVLALEVRRGSNYRYKVLGLIEGMKQAEITS